MENLREGNTIFGKFIKVSRRFIRSFKNFFKSSFISLLVIGIILILLTQMDQAFTMMVDMMEGRWYSLLLSFFFINALAIVLSHYPIYTYYAADLNNSGDYTKWYEVIPLKFWPFKYFPVYIFTINEDSNYKKDNWANYFRYATGMLIHGIWIHFIIGSFKPNIIFEDFNFEIFEIIVYSLLLVPFLLYILLKERIAKLEKDMEENLYTKGKNALSKFYYLLYRWFLFVILACILLLVLSLTIGNFSLGGFVLLLLTSYSLMFNYVLFRILRTSFPEIRNTFSGSLSVRLNPFIGWLCLFSKLEYYILLFNFNFLVASTLLVYSTLASILGWGLHNGIPILLAFFYFYYFIIASLGRYYFVVRKIPRIIRTRRYRVLFVLGCSFVVMLGIDNCANFEVTTHELDLVESSKTEIQEQVFIDSLSAKNDNTLFFIASHGGGLKANVWTLNVLNTLQERTKGKLLNQTIAMSGASGGSLGLALYTGLYREDGLDTQKIQKKIDNLAHENYTSLDLTLTFGMDGYRKFWPFNQRIGLKDRPYYAMVRYQNKIQNHKSKILDTISFRDFWKEAFNLKGYFPSLIMNTSGTKGNRGILWSVKQKEFSDIFPYAENLADLYGNKTLPYYQAVSTTNRFPVFSPAAKISGLGHYIDAGAIDNSGLLGCLDIHNYLLRDKKILGDKQIAYIEIINNKSLYINYLVDEFKKENKLSYIYKDEFEVDNIIVDIKTGLNLDKIPGYLSHYLSNWEQTQNGRLRYFKIFMPHKVSIDDVENYFDGEIANGSVTIKNGLKIFLTTKNNEILSLTEKSEKSFYDEWKYYEPTLSRHLSTSSVRYIKTMLKHPLLEQQFNEIHDLIYAQKIKENESAEITF